MSALLSLTALLSGAAHADDASYGADVSLGYGAGTLLGSWPRPGVHGFVLGRYDAFIEPHDATGPRLGASLWGSWTLWPLQTAAEDDEVFPFTMAQYGVLAVLRFDPEAPVSGLFGFGFGRADLTEYHDGPLALPTLTFEGGLRQGLSKHSSLEHAFVDYALRAHWATTRSPTGESWHEWWLVQGMITFGAHLR